MNGGERVSGGSGYGVRVVWLELWVRVIGLGLG